MKTQRERLFVKFNRFSKRYLADRVRKGNQVTIENVISLDFDKKDRYKVSANFMDLNPPQYPFPRPVKTSFNEAYAKDLILTEFNKEVVVITEKKYNQLVRQLEDNKGRMVG